DLPSHQLVTVAITDMNGQKVYATQIDGIAGKNQLILDNEMISKSGLYLVRLYGISGNKVIKLIKVK
ncbi:MAG: T9SS type A sorting domain-containing protein, partial [Saprospiraceae bacterium]